MKYGIITGILFCLCLSVTAQKQVFHFNNEFGPWPGRTDYYNWKVFLVENPATLNSISRIEYYLDPTFKQATRIVKADSKNPNFTLCLNGWGEFTLRIRIFFKNTRIAPANEIYRLDLHSPSRKNNKYVCQF